MDSDPVPLLVRRSECRPHGPHIAQSRWNVMSGRAYEVRVTGRVPTEDLLQELGDAEIVEEEVRTVVSGRFADQAALHGFLNRLRAYGLEVVEVRRVAGPEPAPSEAGTDSDDTGTVPRVGET